MKKLAFGLSVLITVALMVWGFYQAIYVAPNDAMQGEIFRIIYYHVPSAIGGICVFRHLAGRVDRVSGLPAQPPDGRRCLMPGRWPGPRLAWFSALWC